MSSEALRSLVLRLLNELDEGTREHLLDIVVTAAARHAPAFVAEGPSRDDVRETATFAAAAGRHGYADPGDYDHHLRRGSRAFLARDYVTAAEIFGALLSPLADADVHLGEDESVDEVLEVDVAECVMRLAVATYMTTPAAGRAEAVLQVLVEMEILAYIVRPLCDLESATVEPLPELESFLQAWRELVERKSAAEGRSTWDTRLADWHREVVERLDGVAGLARLAKASGHPADLDAWCDALVSAGEWEAALDAFTEAAAATDAGSHHLGAFLDGAVLAAQRLGSPDLPERLELAWRRAPTLPRLLRWLGAAGDAATVTRWAAAALGSCPERAHRQRAFLCVLVGDLQAAAGLLASAPGLGWSAPEHPGHLLVPLLSDLLDRDVHPGRGTSPWRVDSFVEPAGYRVLGDDPALATPPPGAVLDAAGVGGALDDGLRATLLHALRTAAEGRLAGVTEHKRRRYYSHAAELVAACLEHDRSPEGRVWLASIRTRYRRFYALRAELDRALRA